MRLVGECQAGLYEEAERLGALKPETLDWARVVGAHERAHVQAIKGRLGRKTVPSPTFNYRSVTSDEQAFASLRTQYHDQTGRGRVARGSFLMVIPAARP